MSVESGPVLTPPLYRWGHRGLELRSHFPKPFKLVSCKARNKNHILCLWGSTLSLSPPYLWVESFQSSSSCFSPLLNNMWEHPKADSIWEAGAELVWCAFLWWHELELFAFIVHCESVFTLWTLSVVWLPTRVWFQEPALCPCWHRPWCAWILSLVLFFCGSGW